MSAFSRHIIETPRSESSKAGSLMSAFSRHINETPRSEDSEAGSLMSAFSRHINERSVVMKGVFLDCAIINPGDISWEGLQSMMEFEYYERTAPDQIAERLAGAEAVFIDAAPMTREVIESCPDLKYIGIAATGYNHVDLEAAKQHGIAVTNVSGYAADAVSQHAIALLLYITNKIQTYNDAIIDGEWDKAEDYTFVKAPLTLLAGKSIGIVGYGAIGKRIAEIAGALGMKVNIYSKDREAAVSSDVVSLSCPLTKENTHMINREFISKMKDGAILINTARGGLVDADALADALKSGKLAGAGLDVLESEPPEPDNPLVGLKNCVITPHIAFIPLEARQTIVNTLAENLQSFLDGGELNRIV